MTYDLLIAALPETIVTKRLTLRRPLDRDAAAMTRLANNEKIAKKLRRLPHPYTHEHAMEFIEKGARNPSEHAYAITDKDDAFLGVISFHFEPGENPEIGYWLGEPYWHEGYLSEAITTLFAIVDARAPMDIKGRALSSNKPSLRILEKLGFIATGETFGNCGANQDVTMTHLHRPAANPQIEGLALTLPETIATQRLMLRRPEDADAVSLMHLANNKKIYRMTATMPYPYQLADAEEFIEQSKTLENERAYCIVLPNNQLAGVVGIHCNKQQAPELGYWLGEHFWGQGIAGEAAKSLVDTIDALAPTPLQAWALSKNTGSVRLLQKTGFKRVGEKPSSRDRHEGDLVSYFLRDKPE